MTIAKITDHAQRAADFVLSYLDDSESVHALLAAFAAELQRLEDVAHSVLSVTVQAAVGVELDVYGALVGLQREGLSDEVFRRLILARVAMLQAGGIAELVTNAVAAFVGVPVVYQSPPRIPGFMLQFESADACSPLDDSSVQAVAALFLEGRPVAVTGELSETFAAPTPFGFDHDTDAGGFDVGPLAGGALSARTIANQEGTWLENRPELPTTGLVESFQAADLCALTDQDEVTTWGPLYAAGIGASLGPTYQRTGCVGERGSVDFADAPGSSLGYNGGSGAAEGIVPRTADPFTLYLRVRPHSAHDGVVFAQASQDGGWMDGSLVVAATASGTWVCLLGGSAESGAVDLVADQVVARWVDLVIVRNGTTVDLYVNETLGESEDDPTDLVLGPYGTILGSVAADGEGWLDTQDLFFDGEVSAVVCYSVAHGPDERAAVRAYLDATEGEVVSPDYFRELGQDPDLTNAWPLLETLDDAGGVRTLTAVSGGAALVDVYGQRGFAKARQFNGTGYLNTSIFDLQTGPTDDFTVVGVFSLDATGTANPGMMGAGVNTTTRIFGVYVAGTTVAFKLGDSTGTTAFSTYSLPTVKDGQFRMFAGVVDRGAGTMVVYIFEPGGVSYTGSVGSLVGLGDISPPVGFRVGATTGVATMKGFGLGVHLVQRALTFAELETLAAGILAPPESGFDSGFSSGFGV